MSGPHQDQPIRQSGPALDDADAVIVYVHGRGDTPDGILRLHRFIGQPDVAAIAPAAAGRAWYPNSFLEPVETNEPGRESGLQAIADAISMAADAGIPPERVLLVGFSQGACLVAEFLVAHPDRYGGAGILSGGFLGTNLDRVPRDVDLDSTPVFLGCSDNDPYIPLRRVTETSEILDALGASVTTEIYENRPHSVYAEEREQLATMVDNLG